MQTNRCPHEQIPSRGEMKGEADSSQRELFSFFLDGELLFLYDQS